MSLADKAEHPPMVPSARGTSSVLKGASVSVFCGNRLEAFEVNIIAKFKGGGSAGMDILVGRASGTPVERVGGIPLGASGSPVYVNGKLVGAISGTYPPDNSLIIITPIKAMTSLANEPSLSPSLRAAIATPIPPAVSGITSGRAMGQVELALGRKVVPAPEAAVPSDCRIEPRHEAGRGEVRLKPGSPVGVALMVGDVRVGFIGTVTMLREGQVFAFGHPVTYSGPVCMPMTAATVYDTARGLSPFKVGDIGKTIGTVTQDRAAGILGNLGSSPEGLVSLECVVTDKDRGKTSKVSAYIVPIPDQLARLILTAIIETFSRAMNRAGQGTAEWNWSVVTANGEKTTGSGRAINLSDIGFTVGLELMQPIEQILSGGHLVSSLSMRAVVERRLSLD